MNQSQNRNKLSEAKTYPLVSIVVPVYNHEKYIADCIQSILEQDYPNIELIAINDGSIDSTDQRIREILVKDPARFRYISKKNEGLIKTLNLGLRLARGEYFCELASDDMLLPGSVSKRANHLSQHPELDAIFADAYILDNNVKTNIRLGKDKKRYKSSEHSVKDLIEGRARIFFPSGMFRKTILEDLGGFDEGFRYSEDVAMWYQLAFHAKIGYYDEPVMFYRTHSSNTSSSAPFKIQIRREKILALEKLLPLNADALEATIKKYLCREYLKLAKLSLESRIERSELQDAFRKALNTRTHLAKVLYYFLLCKVKGKLK